MVTVENKTKQTGLCTKQQLKLTLTSYAFLFVCLAFSGVLNMPRQSICGIAITGLHPSNKQFYSTRCFRFTQTNKQFDSSHCFCFAQSNKQIYGSQSFRFGQSNKQFYSSWHEQFLPSNSMLMY